MAIFTQSEIDALISCPKEISEAPARQMKTDGAQLRNDARLIASDGTKGFFSLFLRQSIDFQENFSVGLLYHPQDGRPRVTLLRCNGKHGEFNRGNNAFDPAHPHWSFHIHKATQEALDSGCAAEKYATITTEFASLSEAVRFVLKTVNLRQDDAGKHFAVTSQGEFDFGGS